MQNQEVFLKEYGIRYATGNLKAFLKGKKDSVWLMGTLRIAVNYQGVTVDDLKSIFHQYQQASDADRWQEAYTSCQNEGWF